VKSEAYTAFVFHFEAMPALHRPYRCLRRPAALALLLLLSGIAGAPQIFGPATEPSGPLALAKTMAVLQRKHGGFTYSLYRGNLAGTPGYAVAVFPHRSVVLNGPATERQLAQFVEDNLGLLRDPQLNLGGWYDKRSCKTYLDISAVISSRELAIRMARAHHQQSITDLKSLEEVPIADQEMEL
jgi:hypothetical protein